MQNRGGSPPTVREKSQPLPLGPGEMALPPGEKYASLLGLLYRVRSSAEINWVVQRNLQFLENYVGRNSAHGNQGAKEWALARVSAEPGIRLSEVFLSTLEGMSRDDIYALIANRELYVDLREAPLAFGNFFWSTSAV